MTRDPFEYQRRRMVEKHVIGRGISEALQLDRAVVGGAVAELYGPDGMAVRGMPAVDDRVGGRIRGRSGGARWLPARGGLEVG